ncbi:MAG: hypothetical protein ACFCVE_14130 [Phycisphaerae bacterium]
MAAVTGRTPVPLSTRLPTLGEVLFMPLGELARLDVGFLNLLCAVGLPDTARLDIPACLRRLDEWARRVAAETQRCLHQFRRNPAEYDHSEAVFRAMMMVTVLQEDCGVRYNPDAIKTREFKHAGEGFIHGLLGDDLADNAAGVPMGTCANMPVLYAAVGRRLVYPIYIAGAKGHLFNRWHDAGTGERFNIEGTGRGMNVYPDAHYCEWPRPIRPEDVHHGFYLRNFDPAEELGVFMATRGHCLLDKGHLLDAIVAYGHAHRLCPTDPNNLGFLLSALNHELDLQKQGKLPVSYRQAEGWDERINVDRFVLPSDYVDRFAGTTPIDDQHRQPGPRGPQPGQGVKR